jgi:hypothetical protein
MTPRFKRLTSIGRPVRQNGEAHTLVFAVPMFHEAIGNTSAEIIERDNFVFAVFFPGHQQSVAIGSVRKSSVYLGTGSGA